MEIYQLTQLQRLDLSNNQLGDLPSEISQLTRLRELSLINNPLSKNEAQQNIITSWLPYCIIAWE